MNFSVTIPDIDSLAVWREKARIAISLNIDPDKLSWNEGADGLFSANPLPLVGSDKEIRVAPAFFDLVKSVIWHSDPQRFSMLYRALWRVVHADGHPLSPVDSLGAKLHRMAKSVRRDIHKMHAFVRFQEMPSEGERRRFVAWFEPDHFIVEPGSRFFANRFADMDWMIATPSLCASFDGDWVKFAKFTGKPLLPGDDIATLWGTYFSNIFNPARIKLNAMRSEMPVKYWKNMPETQLIPAMLADAKERVQRMQDAMPKAPRAGAQRITERYRARFTEPSDQPASLEQMGASLQKCQRCQLCEMATKAVPGRGSHQASLMIVGEQPGDREDLEGKAFVGPAGTLLTQTMAEAGVEVGEVYLTNAVKHFKFKVNGKRRIHQNPNRSEIDHCRWWLEQELSLVKPKLVLSLGASAAYSLTERVEKQSQRRGKIEMRQDGLGVLFSWHPSYILRLPNRADQQAALSELRSDLVLARQMSLGIS
jgi:probable DNA metabolism protein